MEGLFLSVLNMSFTASYVIGIIALARLFLKNAPKSISYMLWAVAGFRLVVPFSFESVFSLIPFNPSPIPADIAMQTIPRVDSGIIAVDHAVSRLLPAAIPEASANPMQLWQTAGTYLWLAGVAVMLIYGVVSIILLNRRLRGSTHSEENIYETENLKTPFVLGFIRPKIYIPVGLCAEERNYIILHEQTHIKRFDHAVKLFAFLVLCVHWFNPLVWLAFLLMSVDMEMSCDERVLKELGSDIKKAYSTSLLSMATDHRLINGGPLAFGEGNIKGRINNILNFKKPAVRVIAVSVALAVILCIGLTANKANNENPVPTDEILVAVTGDIPDAVIDYAKEYVGQQVEYYNEIGKNPSSGMDPYTITDAKITGLTEMNTGTAYSEKSISMWRLEYRLQPDNPDNVLLAGGMQMEDIDGKSRITEWGSTGQPYLLLELDFETETWQRVCVTNTDIIEMDYGTPEMLERYGNKYTAAAVGLYHENLKGRSVGYTTGPSDKFSEKEIRSAMGSVIAKFEDFKGCELTRLWYDEKKSDHQIESYMTNGRGAGSGVSRDNMIVVYSDFSVDSSGGDGSLNPNSTYTDWCWILVRDHEKGKWEVDDWGY